MDERCSYTETKNGTNGKTGVSDMLMIFDREVELIQAQTTLIKSGYSYKKKFSFPDPFGIKTLRLVNFIERDYVTRKGITSNYWTSFDHESLNILIR